MSVAVRRCPAVVQVFWFVPLYALTLLLTAFWFQDIAEKGYRVHHKVPPVASPGLLAVVRWVSVPDALVAAWMRLAVAHRCDFSHQLCMSQRGTVSCRRDWSVARDNGGLLEASRHWIGSELRHHVVRHMRRVCIPTAVMAAAFWRCAASSTLFTASNTYGRCGEWTSRLAWRGWRHTGGLASSARCPLGRLLLTCLCTCAALRCCRPFFLGFGVSSTVVPFCFGSTYLNAGVYAIVFPFVSSR
jgi:hypothetical protein